VFGNVLGWNVKGLCYGFEVKICSVLVRSIIIITNTNFKEHTKILDGRIKSDNNTLTGNGTVVGASKVKGRRGIRG